MDISVSPPTPHKCNIVIPDGQVQILHKALTKMVSYLPDNKKLGPRHNNRLKVEEREELIDFYERLEKVIEHINESK